MVVSYEREVEIHNVLQPDGGFSNFAFINKVGAGQMHKVLCLLAAMIQFGNPR